MSTTKSKSRNISGKKDEQTIRTLTRYYPLNEETNSFEIALRYEKASDLFEENTDTFERASRISDSITDRMAEVLDDIPKGYSADISIRVDDYEGYSPSQLLIGIKDVLFFRHRRFLNETIRNGLKIGGLMVAGIIIILIMTIGKQIGWWGGDDTISEILTYLLDTMGCVLIWEGFYLAFVEDSEEYAFERKISHKVSSISFYQENKDRAAASESRESLSALMAINRKRLLMKRLLLISGFSLICVSVAWELQTIGVIINPAKFGEKINSGIVLDILFPILFGTAGVVALRAYEEKLRNWPVVLVFSAVIIYLIINYFITLFTLGSTLVPPQTILAIIIIITGLTFLFGNVMYYIQYRQDQRRDNS